MKEPDSDGRYPLYHSEYEGIKAIAGAYDQYIKKTEPLKERLEVAGVWERYLQVKSDMDDILTKVCMTIPVKKLSMMRKDMENTEVVVRVNPVYLKQPDTFRYVNERDVDDLLDKISEFECWCCAKKGADYKQCSLYDCISRLHPYTFTEQANRLCPFAGGS